MIDKHKHWFKNVFNCKLCWQFSVWLFIVIFIAELLLLVPFYTLFRKEHIALFEKNALEAARVLTADYTLSHSEQLENNILKFSAVKGGILYDLEGNVVKKFGINPKVSPADFEELPVINGQFYYKDDEHYYTLWNARELEAPFEMVAIVDNTHLKTTLSDFIKTYWSIALLLLIVLTLASLLISYYLLIRPIRNAYLSIQRLEGNLPSAITYIDFLPSNELGFIFNVVNTTFSKLQLTLHELHQKTRELNILNENLEIQVDQRTQKLNDANKALAAMALFPEQNQNPTFRVNANGNIIYANKACKTLFHFWSCEKTNILPAEWIQVLNAVLLSKTHKQIEILVNGHAFLLDFIPIVAENYVNVYAIDISERKRIEQENRFLQSHNPLTKIFNRHFFKLLFDEKKSKSTFFGLLFLHMNDYIPISQHLGQAVADKFLQHSAKILKSNISKEDLLGHFSSYLFAIAAYHCHSIEELDNFALHLISIFSREFIIDSYTLHSSINIGIALYPTDQTDTELLFQFADMALLQAHNVGVNTFQFYTPEINQQLLKHHELYQDLHRAVLEKQLTLVYQPQLSLHTNKIIGAETLIRWHHPAKGLISPDEFITILENSSLIFLITEWLFETAAKMHNRLKEKGLGEFRLAINLTAKQLNQENLLSILIKTIEKFSIKAKFIEIEITERVSLTEPEKCIKTLNSIRHLGFQLALDDFGTDYSSLKYLQKLPIGKIKIDKSFVENVLEKQENQKIVKAIIQLAKELNLKTLAEGIELPQQVELLKQLECDEIQGYLVSMPLDEKAFEEFCKNK